MGALAVPAPLWRRLAASLYDGLLLLGLWMLALWLDVLVREAFALPRSTPALRAYLFLIGLAFFAWFWTHGGQTLGMRVWRLQVLRADGGALRWPDAALRYAVAWISLLALGLGFLWCLVDPERRSWHDLASGTRLILLPPRNGRPG